GWRVGHDLEQRDRDLDADGRARLQEQLVLPGQTIDARGEHRLHAVRDLDALDGLAEPVVTALARQRARLDQRLHGLLEEEGIARGVGDEAALERPQLGLAAEKRVGERLRTL